MMMGYWYGELGWIGLVINLVFSIGVMIGLVFLVVWIVKQFSNHNPGRMLNNTAPSAVEIVKERYAKGEITRDEYQKLVADLGTG